MIYVNSLSEANFSFIEEVKDPSTPVCPTTDTKQ